MSLKKLLVVIALVAAGFVLANSAGKFAEPGVSIILNFTVSFLLVIVFYKPNYLNGLEITMMLVFVSVAISTLEHVGIYATLCAFANAGVALYKITPKERE